MRYCEWRGERRLERRRELHRSIGAAAPEALQALRVVASFPGHAVCVEDGVQRRGGRRAWGCQRGGKQRGGAGEMLQPEYRIRGGEPWDGGGGGSAGQ